MLFVDGDLWEPFGQFAAALRQHGIASDHLTVAPRHWRSRYSQGLEKVLYARTAHRVLRPPPPGGAAWVSPRDVVRWVTPHTLDIQARDDLGHQLLSDPITRGSPLRHAQALERPEQVYDKWLMTTLARRINVPTPDSWPVADGPPRPGSTVVVKAPVGFGGQGMAVVRNQRDWSDAVSRVRRSGGGEPFAQSLVGTRTLNVAGVAQDGRILVSACYEASPPPHDPLAPAESIRLLHHGEALQGAQGLVEATGYHGLFCIDFALSPDGQALFLDFNPRVFGSWGALQELGFDLIGAYLATLGIGRGPRWQRRWGANRAWTLTPPPPGGAIGAWLNRRWAIIARQRPWCGRTWALTARARTLAFAAEASVRRISGDNS